MRLDFLLMALCHTHLLAASCLFPSHSAGWLNHTSVPSRATAAHLMLAFKPTAPVSTTRLQQATTMSQLIKLCSTSNFFVTHCNASMSAFTRAARLPADAFEGACALLACKKVGLVP